VLVTDFNLSMKYRWWTFGFVCFVFSEPHWDYSEGKR